jgi:outer membrane protein OmpA-like peptidoglycan-associated protein
MDTDDKTQVAPIPRISRSARPRFVLGWVLLILGLGDVLFMGVVLLPQVLAVETGSPSRPVVNNLPAEPPAQVGPEAGPTVAREPMVAPPAAPASAPAALVPAEQPAAEPARSAASPQAARPSLARVEPPAAGPAMVPSPRERAAPSFTPLHFYVDSAWLSAEAVETLSKVAAALKADSTLRVTLGGHTDDFGPERLNQVLSLKRAERARERLQVLGIGQARIDIKGFGSEQPADTEHTAQARARNRRVEITLY